jgi:hypothetical protein
MRVRSWALARNQTGVTRGGRGSCAAVGGRWCTRRQLARRPMSPSGLPSSIRPTPGCRIMELPKPTVARAKPAETLLTHLGCGPPSGVDCAVSPIALSKSDAVRARRAEAADCAYSRARMCKRNQGAAPANHRGAARAGRHSECKCWLALTPLCNANQGWDRHFSGFSESSLDFKNITAMVGSIEEGRKKGEGAIQNTIPMPVNRKPTESVNNSS